MHASVMISVQAMEVSVVASCNRGFQGYLESYVGEEYNSLSVEENKAILRVHVQWPFKQRHHSLEFKGRYRGVA